MASAFSGAAWLEARSRGELAGLEALAGDRRGLNTRLRELDLAELGDRAAVSNLIPPPTRADRAAAPGPSGRGSSLYDEAGEISCPEDCRGTPFEALYVADLWQRLAAHPDTRPHVTDTGFVGTLKELRRGGLDAQARSRKAMDDPRVMAAVVALGGGGMRLQVTEADMRHAESVGDMKRRDPVQLEHLERAQRLGTAVEAKAAGNAAFGRAAYDDAVACYIRAIDLEGRAPSPDAAFCCTVHSNVAAALLKLGRPNDAIGACERALAVPADALAALAASGVVAKARAPLARSWQQHTEPPPPRQVHYRRALAHEAIGVAEPAVRKAVGSFASAVDAAKASVASAGGVTPFMKAECARLDAKLANARRGAAEWEAQRARERDAEALRAAGVGVGAPPAAGAPAAGALAPRTRSLGRGYVAEVDFSHWAATWLADAVRGLTHEKGGCRVAVRALSADRSEVHASVKQKVGKAGRSIFYDLSLVLDWDASSSRGRAEPAHMRGVFRMYNIGQDTRFKPGGDVETSYMYELGFPREHFGATEPWAEQIKTEAAELYFMMGEDVLPRFTAELVRKAESAAMG